MVHLEVLEVVVLVVQQLLADLERAHRVLQEVRELLVSQESDLLAVEEELEVLAQQQQVQ
jgi:hypothetical protein